MNCLFCQGATGSRPSNEHLLSVPVCRAFGINRATLTARVDGVTMQVKSVAQLHSTQVRLPCQVCNSGWMNRLEFAMETVVGPWTRTERRLGTTGCSVLSRWALKTHIVLSALDGGSKAFGTTCQEAKMGVLPEATRARQLLEGDTAAFAGVKIGVARVSTSPYLWGFGHPTVVPKGPRYANARSASVSCLNLGSMQLWTVVPVFSSALVQLPPKMTVLATNLVFARLPLASASEPALESAVVDNGEHDIDAVFAAAANRLSTR